MLIAAVHALVTVALTVLAGVWPLDPAPEVVGEFAPPAERWNAGHRGVDLLGEAGQVVRAAVPGTVTYAGMIAGRGVVVVGHGETRTTYQPVAASVAVGDVVSAGQSLGTLQAGGSHCRPRVCLHWGMLRGDTYLDPLTLVGAGPVRLLPLFSPVPVMALGLSLPAASPLARPPAPTSLRTTAAPPTPWRMTAAFPANTWFRPAGAPDGRPSATGPW